MDVSLANLAKLPRVIAAISPLEQDITSLTIKRCEEIVSTSQVKARGWYFPHINRARLAAGPNGDFLGSETETPGFTVAHIEKWRLYTSGQFVQQSLLWEASSDSMQKQMRAAWGGSEANSTQIPGFVSFIGLIYSVSEAYAFAANLAQGVPYRSAATITTGLREVQGWSLGSTDFAVDISTYISPSNAPTHSAEVPLDRLVADPLVPAGDAIASIFAQFGWLDPQASMIRSWQTQIFSRPHR